MGDQPTAVLLAVFAIISGAYIARWLSDPLRKIPTVGGPSAPILSYWGAFNYIWNAKALLTEGYERYHESAFKVALFDRWIVVVSGPRMVDDMRKRPDDELSSYEGIEEMMHLRFTFGREIYDDQYQTNMIRDNLTKSLPAVLPDVMDELSLALPEHIDLAHDSSGWVAVNIKNATLNIVARASNRVFVGIPVCRNQSYLDLCMKFTLAIAKDRLWLGLAPRAVRHFLAKSFSATRRTLRESLPHLKPIIDERKAKMEAYGDDYQGKPNNFLQWILEEALARGSTDYQIVERIMLLNFASIHTSSLSISHALLHLAAEPQYLQPLRDEVEAIVSAEGWTKKAMDRMRNIDSFLKESLRMNSNLAMMTRKALRSTTLVDGTFIPGGTLLTTAVHPAHYDEHIYEDASVFDPFRFARLHAVDGEGTKHHMDRPSLEYLPFGYGKHACPGRFFGAMELKAILAYIVLNYDIKLPGDGPRPDNIYFRTFLITDSKAKVLFRRRQSVARPPDAGH